MKIRSFFAAAAFFLLTVQIPYASSEEEKPEEFDSWAQEFRQSLSDEEREKAGNDEPAPAASKQSGAGGESVSAPAGNGQAIPKATPASKLVDLNMEKGAQPDVIGLDTADVDDLERRVDRLERDIRFMEDRLRTVDRTVDDLRRRR